MPRLWIVNPDGKAFGDVPYLLSSQSAASILLTVIYPSRRDMTLTRTGQFGSLLKLSLLGCAVSLVAATPASAQSAQGCLVQGSTATFTYRQATQAGFSCQVTDKILGQFSPNAQGIDLDSVFTFSEQNPTEHLLQLSQASGIRVPGAISYTLTVSGAPNTYVVAGQTQGFVPLIAGSTSQKSVFMDGMSPATVTSVGGVNSPIGTFPFPGSTFFTVVDSWVPTSAPFGPDYLTGFNTKFGQKVYGPGVPGPLPLLGAGAAFGFSRRLRRRVRQAAA